ISDATACPFVRLQRRNVVVLPQDRAATYRLMADDCTQQTGFSDTVAAEHASHFADRRSEGNRAQRLRGAVMQVHCVYFQHRRVRQPLIVPDTLRSRARRSKPDLLTPLRAPSLRVAP